MIILCVCLYALYHFTKPAQDHCHAGLYQTTEFGFVPKMSLWENASLVLLRPVILQCPDNLCC